MIYADVVATGALLIALFSVGWQVYTWLHQKKREETPNLNVRLRKIQGKDFFVIENVGKCGITILDCTINNFKLDQCLAADKAHSNISSVRIEPQNLLNVSWYKSRGTLRQTPIGSPVELKIKTDSGKFFELVYNLYEE